MAGKDDRIGRAKAVLYGEKPIASQRHSPREVIDAETELEDFDDNQAEYRQPKQRVPSTPVLPAESRYREALKKSQPGLSRSVTDATVQNAGTAAFVIPVPVDLARVQVDPDLARGWAVTLSDLGAIVIRDAEVQRQPVQFGAPGTKCLLRWGLHGIINEARFDWRMGQVAVVYGDFVEVTVEFDPEAFTLVGAEPDTLRGAATIVEAAGPGPIRPTFTGPRFSVDSQQFGTIQVIPVWSTHLTLYKSEIELVSGDPQVGVGGHFIQFFQADPGAAPAAQATLVYAGSPFFPNANNAPVLLPNWATRFRVWNDNPAVEGNPVIFTPIFTLGL